MAAITKTYIPAPNWDIPATSTIVTLGAIIKDPRNPESVVKSHKVITIPDEAIQHCGKASWTTTSTEILAGKLGLWAQCLQMVGVGGDASFSGLKSALEEHKFDELETKYFVPETVDGYLEACVKSDYVHAYFEATGFRKPLFMIVGIKIAKGAKVASEMKREIEGEAKVGVDLTALAAPVTLGPEGSLKRTRERSVKWAGSTDYIFAYRLVKIRCKKGGNFGIDDCNKGAVFGRDDEDDDEDYDEDEEREKSFQDEYNAEDYDGEGLGIPDEVEEVD